MLRIEFKHNPVYSAFNKFNSMWQFIKNETKIVFSLNLSLNEWVTESNLSQNSPFTKKP